MNDQDQKQPREVARTRIIDAEGNRITVLDHAPEPEPSNTGALVAEQLKQLRKTMTA